VPCLADFARLDERFRLAPSVWAGIPEVADWGFAVFQLSPERGWLGGVRDQTVHPMAFEFPLREPGALFFPTLHIHDGAVHPTAHFDHTLYCQADGILGATLAWTRSNGPLGAEVNELRSRGLVRGDAGGFSLALEGERPNRDVVLRPPAWSGGDVTRVAGDCWAAQLHGSYAFADERTVPPDRRAWIATSRHHLDRIFAALRDELPVLIAARRQEWNLTAYPGGELPSFWPSRYPTKQKRGAFLFMGELYTPSVEHQEIALCFRAAPSMELEQAIQRELRALLEDSLAA